MTVDWFTVVAQIINFLILMWLLKRFLYNPIIGAIDGRSQHIESELESALHTRQNAEQQLDLYQQKSAQLEQQKQDILEQAMAEARQHADTMRAHSEQQLASMNKQLITEYKHQLQQYQSDVIKQNMLAVYQTASKVLEDLADLDLHDKIIDTFCGRLAQQPPLQLTRLIEDQSGHTIKLRVISAISLSAAQKDKIEHTINHLGTIVQGDNVSFVYQVDAALISGVELKTDDWKTTWSTTDYLNLLQHKVTSIVQQQQAELATKFSASKFSLAAESDKPKSTT
ncbi:F0F1 ATP synthase subunit delta [Aliiglaciecola sp. LCG003]|uniref:F0F1 ATP synthase subunit B family protein n=1 Tax=Aliiglaciecola sp. LCG003 TaxID=3053655 RepID=UPI0025724058|nr:F0F1 ATP synthase subunit delta [Aliiglaciecola sp. LCG003]WJG07703.1 hypothetical protein QR722_10000 [Aliiglaciecola sp. LCG003]